MITYVDFDRIKAVAHKFTDNFMIKIEAIAVKPQSINAVTPEDLVHSERITQGLLEYRIDQPCEEEVPNIHNISQMDRSIEFSDFPDFSPAG